MAKNKRSITKRYETGSQISTPSWFGSHISMVVDHNELSYSENNKEPVVCESGMVLCKDDSGYYFTYKNRLDSGLADPCRYSSKRPNLFQNPSNDCV